MEKKTGGSRKEKALETKSRLYAVADKLFTQYGYENVSVDRIVAEAAISLSSSTVHFPLGLACLRRIS